MATVLVVDDEPQVRHALRRALEGEGDRVLCAATGTEAVDLAAAETPDLVVLDLWLPDIDGVEVVRRLRGWLDVPILILSGDSDTERKVGALDSGADDFLQKPFGFPELTARLRALKRRTVRVEADRRLSFGRHYAETLRQWDQRFLAESRAVLELGFDETFLRMWHFYLEYSRAGFASDYLDVNQLVLARPAEQDDAR